MEKIDINIEELSKQENIGLKQSHLKLLIHGNSINSSFINSIRRTPALYVPTYAFYKDSIEISENTSVVHNDYMKCRLEQFTYPRIRNDIVILEDKYWKDVNYKSNTREKHPLDTVNIEVLINATNNKKEMINVTTNDATVYDNNTKVENNFNHEFPMLVVQLKEGQSFKCRCKCVLGLGIVNDIWAGSSNCFYEEVDGHEDKYKFTIESQGQMDEYELLKKSCIILIDKMEKIKLYFMEKFREVDLSDVNEITIELDNEDIMIGSVLNETFQMNKYISFSGISRPFSFNKKTFIKIISTTKNPMIHIFESIDYIINCYKDFDSKITRLGKKYISYKY